MLIYVFPPHYQLVCANSYTSSFSLISYGGINLSSRENICTITVVFFCHREGIIYNSGNFDFIMRYDAVNYAL